MNDTTSHGEKRKPEKDESENRFSISTAIKNGKDDDFILKLINSDLEDIKDYSEIHSLLADSLYYNRDVIRNYLIAKLDIKYNWIDIFSQVVDDAKFNLKCNNSLTLNLKNFYFILNKINFPSASVAQLSENFYYNFTTKFPSIFLRTSLTLSKQFIDYYRVNDIPININYYSNNLLYKLNKDSFLYYLLKFSKADIPSNYLSGKDIEYFLENNIDESRLENVELRPMLASDYASIFKSLKIKTLPEIQEMISTIV